MEVSFSKMCSTRKMKLMLQHEKRMPCPSCPSCGQMCSKSHVSRTTGLLSSCLFLDKVCNNGGTHVGVGMNYQTINHIKPSKERAIKPEKKVMSSSHKRPHGILWGRRYMGKSWVTRPLCLWSLSCLHGCQHHPDPLLGLAQVPWVGPGRSLSPMVW